MVGWGVVIVILGCMGLAYMIGMVGGLAALGVFLALVGLSLAVLSAWGPAEPLLAGGGAVALVLGASIAMLAYDLFSAPVILFIVILVAGIGLIAVGLRRR